MKNYGFSLLEMLVTTMIIGLLMAILAPVLRLSRGAAERALCASNMRQLYIGLISYEIDNKILPPGFYRLLASQDDLGVPPGGLKGNSAIDRRGWWWFDFVNQHYSLNNGIEDVLYCPSGKTTVSGMLRGNYGVNQSICREFNRIFRSEFIGDRSLSSINVRNPAQLLFLTDSGHSLINWKSAADHPPSLTADERRSYLPGLSVNLGRPILAEFWDDALTGRHTNNTVNVIFLDGHIETLPAEKLMVTKTGDNYANRLLLWTPRQ